MIELRWFDSTAKDGLPGYSRLQYRQLDLRIDASGALSAAGVQWSEWQDVPNVKEEE